MSLPRQEVLQQRRAAEIRQEQARQAELAREAAVKAATPDEFYRRQEEIQSRRETIKQTQENINRLLQESKEARERGDFDTANSKRRLASNQSTIIKSNQERISKAERKLRDIRKTRDRALRKNVSFREAEKQLRTKERRRENRLEATANAQGNLSARQERELERKFGKEVLAEFSPEAKINAYKQLKGDFEVTPNTAAAKDRANRRQEVLTQTLKSIDERKRERAAEQQTVRASSQNVLRSDAPTAAPLQPTKERIDGRANLSTEQGQVFVSQDDAVRQPAPNTSTEQGAVFTPAPTVRETSFFENLGNALKTAGKQTTSGFFFTQGLNPESNNTAERGLYRTGQVVGTVLPVGLAAKTVGLAYRGTQAAIAATGATGVSRLSLQVGAFGAGQAAIAGGTIGYSNLLTSRQIKEGTQGIDISPQEFRATNRAALELARKEGFLSNAAFSVSSRFGVDNEQYEQNLRNAYTSQGFSPQEVDQLVTTSQRVRGGREGVEAPGIVLGAGLTELVGRNLFSSANTAVTRVFTRKTLREGTFKPLKTIDLTPKTAIPTYSISQAQALGTTATTKGGALIILGTGEGAQQELTTQGTRTGTYDFGEVAKSGYVGGVAAATLGVPIARYAEVGNKGGSKGVNTIANIADPFELPGDLTADAISTGRFPKETPTVTTTGKGLRPDLTFSSQRYFSDVNKGQDTLRVSGDTRFTPVVTPTASFKPAPLVSDTTSPPAPAPAPVPSPVPAPAPAPVPTGTTTTTTAPTATTTTSTTTTAPVPVPVPVPVPTTTTAPVPIPVVTPTNPAAPIAFPNFFGSSSGTQQKKRKPLFKYTPSAFALVTGITGKQPSKTAVRTGFSIRPITKSNKRKKEEEELKKLLKLNGTRKRTGKRFGAF